MISSVPSQAAAGWEEYTKSSCPEEPEANVVEKAPIVKVFPFHPSPHESFIYKVYVAPSFTSAE